MSGHSKWANIQHRKGVVDKKRSETFTKLARNILTALRSGNEVSLRTAIDRAKAANMPKENIDRLLKRFEERKANLTSFWLEGYGPGGVAMMIEVETDNKNRILSEVRLIMRDHGGNLVEEGSVRFLFERLVEVEYDKISEEMQLELIDEGAREIAGNKVYFEVGAREGRLVMRAKTRLNSEVEGQVMELVEALEENEEVVNVFTNLIDEP